MDHKLVERLKQQYPEGTRVRLVYMDDPQAPAEGTLGTVLDVDDLGSLLIKWDSGSSLNVLYGIDRIEKL